MRCGRRDHRRVEIGEGDVAQLRRFGHGGHQFENGALDAGGRNVGFQTAAASAAALAAAPHGDHVAEFAGEAVVAVDHLAIGDESRTESRPERDHDEILHPLGVAVDHLADRGGVGVVGHPALDARERLLDVVHQREHAAALVGIGFADGELPQVGRVFDHARVVIGVGRADADAHQLVFEREAVGQRMQRFGQLGHIGRIVGEKREFLGRYDRIGIEGAVLVHRRPC